MSEPHRIIFTTTASTVVDVPNRGQSREEAIEEASAEAYVSLCHQCAGEVDLGDFEPYEPEPDGDTGTRAIVQPGKTFVRYTETNDSEGETWTFWLQRDGNEKPLRWLADFLANVNAEDLDPEHELFLDDVLPEDHVDVLARWGGEAYMPLHSKVIGTMSIPEKFSPGDLYKGDVAELFTVVSDDDQ